MKKINNNNNNNNKYEFYLTKFMPDTKCFAIDIPIDSLYLLGINMYVFFIFFFMPGI